LHHVYMFVTVTESRNENARASIWSALQADVTSMTPERSIALGCASGDKRQASRAKVLMNGSGREYVVERERRRRRERW